MAEKLAVDPLDSFILVTNKKNKSFLAFISLLWILQVFILVTGVNVQTGEEVAVKLVIKLFLMTRECLLILMTFFFFYNIINGKRERISLF